MKEEGEREAEEEVQDVGGVEASVGVLSAERVVLVLLLVGEPGGGRGQLGGEVVEGHGVEGRLELELEELAELGRELSEELGELVVGHGGVPDGGVEGAALLGVVDVETVGPSGDVEDVALERADIKVEEVAWEWSG